NRRFVMLIERTLRSLRSRRSMTKRRAAEGGREPLTHHLEFEALSIAIKATKKRQAASGKLLKSIYERNSPSHFNCSRHLVVCSDNRDCQNRQPVLAKIPSGHLSRRAGSSLRVWNFLSHHLRLSGAAVQGSESDGVDCLSVWTWRRIDFRRIRVLDQS